MVKLFPSMLAAAAASLALGLPHETAPRAAWPDGPLVTSGRWIRNASGQNVTYAGVNWPGAADAMLPEGLQFQSIASIVTKIKSVGVNSIRLTYAIQMIDEIYDNGGKDITIEASFNKALGAANGAKVLKQVLAKNPSFNASTTRLQVGERAQPGNFPGAKRGE